MSAQPTRSRDESDAAMSSTSSTNRRRTGALSTIHADLSGLSQGFLPIFTPGRRDAGAQSTLAARRALDEFTDDMKPFVERVLKPIPRSDQRRWGRFYIRGLLLTPGRKTVTRIVQELAAPPADQSLQQFINQSPWDWRPVRRELADMMQRLVSPEAWVVQPAFFPKSGDRSVGVTRQFVPPLAKLLNCQAAMSLWLAGPEWGVPVDWRLVVPASWANDAKRRADVGMPEEATAEEQWETAIELVAMAVPNIQVREQRATMEKM